MKPMLKPPGTKHLKLKCDILLSTSAFKFNLRGYNPADPIEVRGLKLEILTHIATADNAAQLLRELQAGP